MHRGSERDVGGLSAAALSPCGSFDPFSAVGQDIASMSMPTA